MKKALSIFGIVFWGWFSPSLVHAQPSGEKSIALQARDLLQANCFRCHGEGNRARSDLFVLDYPALIQSKMIVPKQVDDSPLIKRLNDPDNPMPPKGLLTEAQRQLLADWVGGGAMDWNQSMVQGKVEVKNIVDAKDTTASVKTIFLTHCANCHEGSKPEASLSIFDRAKLVDEKTKYIVPGNPEDSTLVKRITSQKPSMRMPPNGDGLSVEEISLIKDWIRSGAKEFESGIVFKETEVGEEAVLKTIYKDVLEQLANNQTHRFRYFSLNHLIPSGITARGLQDHRDAFVLVLNSLSWKPEIVQPVPLDELKTIYRVDITGLGWDEKPFVSLDKKTNKPIDANTPAELTLYDLLLLDYPYGIYDANSKTLQELAQTFFSKAKQVRPIPYLRADWLVNVAATSPIYEDLLKLPRSLPGLAKLLEVNLEENLRDSKVVRGGVSLSGISRNNRVIERHVGSRTNYLWVSYDFKTNRGGENMFRNPVQLKDHATGNEMIFALPNRLQGYFICDSKGSFLASAPVEIVTDKFASDQTVRNGLACMRCHESGMRTIKDDMHPVFANLTGNVGLDKRKILEIYPGQEILDKHFKQDKESFEKSLKQLYPNGVPNLSNILLSASKRYIDTPISDRVIPSEMGSRENTTLLFKGKNLASLGLFQLSRKGGVVRRDTWEDVFSEVIRECDLGIPFVPFDGMIRKDYEALNSSKEKLTLTIQGARGANGEKVAFEGDRVFIEVKNTTSKEMYLELVVRLINGKMVAITKEPQRLDPGASFRFPENDKGIQINAGKGTDQLIMFSSAKPFEGGELCRIRKEDADRGYQIADRFVHREFYRLKQEDRDWKISMDAKEIFKQTVNLETK